MSDARGRAHFTELPLGAVRPLGWLHRQLELQASGITGRLPDVWPNVSDDNAWLGGTGEFWEQGPYYLDGLVALAHVVQDQALLERTQRWVEAILRSQQRNGLFGPTRDDDWWPRMVAIKALAQHYDAVGDARILDLLGSYFSYQLTELPRRPLQGWGRYRAAENALVALWFADVTGDTKGLDVARLAIDQGADWSKFLRSNGATTKAHRFSHFTHVVNVAMALKEPAVRYLLDGNPVHLESLDFARGILERFHGQVHGLFSGDEWLAGRSPTQGVETCAVVEYLYSLEQTVRIFGTPELQDEIERVGFNLLPAAFDSRVTVRSYHQQPNQVQATIEQRPWTFAFDDANIFGTETSFGCCTANCHQGWPKLVRSSWLSDRDGALVLMSFAPTSVDAVTIEGTPYRFEVEGNYPFDEVVRIRAVASNAFDQAIRIRTPGWASGAVAVIDGQPIQMTPGGYFSIARVWQPDDAVTLTLPMSVVTTPRDHGAVGIRLGPVQLVHWPGETWNRVQGTPDPGDWEVRPRRTWNRAIVTSGAGVVSARVERADVGRIPFALEAGSQPFGIKGAPLQVFVGTQRVPDWTLDQGSAAEPPASPVATEMPVEMVPLVPYGSTRLRIAEFPTAVGEPTTVSVYQQDPD